jgi:hypothetical protein
MNLHAFCKPLQCLKTLILVYQISNYFQFAPSVRVFREILTDLTKITHLSLTPLGLKRRSFGVRDKWVILVRSVRISRENPNGMGKLKAIRNFVHQNESF